MTSDSKKPMVRGVPHNTDVVQYIVTLSLVDTIYSYWTRQAHSHML